MRRLMWLFVLFALAWGGWWLFASQSFQSSISLWFSERRAEGWQADFAEVQTSGFPAKLETLLVEPALADPATGLALETDSFLISAPAWWPGHVSLFLPGNEIRLASPFEKHVVSARDARADLRLHPGTMLELEEMALNSGPWDVKTPQGGIAGATSLVLSMRQNSDAPLVYQFSFDAPDFQPGAVPRAALRIPAHWPLTFDSLSLEARIAFDRPFDRRTLEQERPQPRQINLTKAEAIWGDLLVRSTGDLEVSADGLLTGEVSMQARNWQQILDLAENAGALPSGLRPQVDNILAALARGSGNPDSLDVTLSLRSGTIFLGFIPIGAAPRVVLR